MTDDPTAGSAPPPGTVLVVDDDPDLRDSIEAALIARGHPVAKASDGLEALAWLRGHDPPCLVLLDLMMPGMNGFELRARMRADPGLASIPVVVITGAGPLADLRAAELEAEVLRKPVELGTLIATVRRFCAFLAPA